MINQFTLLLYLIRMINCLDEMDIKHCRERNRLIETEKGDLYMLVDAVLGKKITLQCHYCNENDDQRAKNWYKIDDISTKAAHEVQLDMNNNPSRQTIHVNDEHSLIINRFQTSNIGLYYCVRFEAEEKTEKLNYLLDIVNEQENQTDFESGNITLWSKYSEEYFAPINHLLVKSNGDEFARVREGYRIQMLMVTQWRHWGACEVCGMPNNQGVRKRVGFCRLKLTKRSSSYIKIETSDEKFFTHMNFISCQSALLERLVPEIYRMTRIVPHFVQSEHCDGICNPDALAVGAGWKTGKTSGFKYRKTVVLEQNAHLTVICPESNLDTVVQWKRNGKQLKRGESVAPKDPQDEPRIIVDTFNTLYLVSVQDSEAGNYTCQVDDTRMQQIIVYVISKKRILSQAFVRYIIYLGFILSLTLPCYCAGLIIACSRRRSFKNYEELKEMEEGPEKYKLYQE